MAISFGRNGQVSFNNLQEYYYALGFLASAKRTSLHWENNEEQGAWGSEGRIHCYSDLGSFPSSFSTTAGNGSILRRINCNDYVGKLVTEHYFKLGRVMQDVAAIRATVPPAYYKDFDAGYAR